MKFVLIKKRGLVLSAIAAAVVAMLITAVALTGAAAVHADKTARKLPVYAVQTDEKKVAITFDASWGADKTDALRDAVVSHDISATFFAVGMWADKYPDKLKGLYESGRFEIGTHSNTHPDMTKLSTPEIRRELETSLAAISAVTGAVPTLFRAPFGAYNDRLLTTTEELGLMTIQWDVDSLDWKGLSSIEMAARILKRTTNGSIILMHNDGEHTVAALPAIIEGLKNKGYTFVTVGELVYTEGYTIDHTGRQIHIGG